MLILTLWVVLPPVWFWYEYFFVYKPKPYAGEDWDRFKYAQDQAEKIWLALLVALLGLYFGKEFTK